MSFDKISTLSVREAFVREIENKILSGELKPGDKLPPARELCKIMGVSLTVVNAGVSELASKGFIEVKPRHGTYVADYIASGNYDTLHEILRSGEQHMTRERIVALVETRNAIEGGALIRLAASHTGEDIRVLEDYIERFRAVRGRGLSADELGTMTKDFHYLICRLSGNEVFILIMNSFAEISQGLWRHCAGHWGLEGLIEQSEHIVSLIKAGRGLDAQVYITEKFNEFVRERGIIL